MASPGLLVLNFFFGGVALMLLFHRRYRGRAFGAVMLSGCLLFALRFAWDLSGDAASGTGTLQSHLGQVVFAALGAGVGWSIARGVSARPPFGLGSALALACTVSFVWVLSYGYRYNYAELNASSFSLFAFAFWSLGLVLLIALSRQLEGWVRHGALRLGLVWLSYLLCLMLLEYVGYQIFGVREISKGIHHDPLALGLIHGTATMKVFYLSAGALTALLDVAHRMLRRDDRRKSGAPMSASVV